MLEGFFESIALTLFASWCKLQDVNNASHLLTSVLHVAELVQQRLEAALAPTGLSLAKLGALRHLAEADQPLPLGQLAERIACVKSNVTQLVDRLEADGWFAVCPILTTDGRFARQLPTRVASAMRQENELCWVPKARSSRSSNHVIRNSLRICSRACPLDPCFFLIIFQY